MSHVASVAAASPDQALRHFGEEFTFETDCADVHDAIAKDQKDFVLIDARSHDLFDQGHVPGAISVPHGKIIASKLEQWSLDTLFVTYCAGPHCNGAARAALRIAGLGRPVKIMAGGISGWLDEGYKLQISEIDRRTNQSTCAV